MVTNNFFVHDGLKVRGDTLLNGDTYNDTALSKLHVKTADNGVSATLDNVKGLIIENADTSNTTYALKLATGIGNIFSITNAGNLGIGTTAPSAPLDVAGTICADSDSWFNGVRVGRGNNNCNTNTVVGSYSLDSNTTGDYNTASGYAVLRCNTTGRFNVGFGACSLFSNEISDRNTAIGFSSLYYNTSGANNTASGYHSLYCNIQGNSNAAYGSCSLFSNTTGVNNTATGTNSLWANTTGSYNTSNGAQSLFCNTTGSKNTASGYQSLNNNTTASNNTSYGHQSLFCNTTGTSNTASGICSLYYNTTGYNNVANGSNSLFCNTTGYNNTAQGNKSLCKNTTGYHNTASGYGAIRSNTTGLRNTGIGYAALFNNTTGQYNTSTGSYSLFKNTTGIYNTGYGYESLRNNTTGNCNISLGYFSGCNITTGDKNITIGLATCTSTSGDTNSIVIGNNLTGLGSNTINIGNSSNTKTVFEYGNVGIGTTDPNEKLTVSGNISASGVIYADAFNSKTGGTTIDFNDDVDLNGNLTFSSSSDILIPDNAEAALEIKEGSNVYQRFITTNGGEKIELYKYTIASAGFFTNSLTATSISTPLILAGDGSVSAPSYSFTGDTNTGMWRPGSDQLRFNTGGVDRLCLTSSLATFTNSVCINDNITVAGNLIVHGACTTLNTTVTATSAFRVDNDGTGPALVANQTGSQPIADFQDDGTSVLYIEDGGNVGLGTTNPEAGLHIYGSGQQSLFVGSSNGARALLELDGAANGDGAGGDYAYLAHNADGSLEIKNLQNNSTNFATGSAGTTRMTITSGGNVGIGTDDPTSLLHIDTAANSAANFKLGADRTAANAAIGQIIGAWDGTAVAKIALKTGDDTTNKDDGEIAFEVAAAGSTAEAMRIDSSGNVGIGTSSPGTKLQIDSGSGIGTVDNAYSLAIRGDGIDGIQILSDSAYSGRIVFGDQNSNNAGRIYYDHSTDAFRFFTNGTENVSILSGGNVGIGTDDPQRPFTLYKATNPVLQLVNSTTGTGIGSGFLLTQLALNTTIENSEAGYMAFRTSADEKMRIDAAGNVGIGTTSPTGGKLQVAGKVRIDAGSGNDALNLNAYDLLKWDNGDHIHFGGYKSGQWTVLKFYSSSTERLNIGSDVNVQGATDLNINGPSRRLRFTSGTGTIRTTSANKLYLQTDSTDALTIDASQNVGIGTTDPETKLDVEGDTRVDGELWIGGLTPLSANSSIQSFSTGLIFSNMSVELGRMQRLSTTSGRIAMNQYSINDTAAQYPAFTFKDDENTGMYLHCADTLGFSTGGASRMVIDSAGAAKFNAYGSGTHTGTQAYNLGVDSSGNIIEIDLGDGVIDGCGTANRLAYWSDTSTLTADSDLYYDSTNNYIGIGTDTPGEAIDIVNGNVQADEFIGNLRGAVLFKAKAGEALTKGDAVYISGISGNTTVVGKADADDAAKMPAFGIADETASLNSSVNIIKFGTVSNLNTSAFPEGTELYIGTTAGALVSSAPTGESAAVQKIAKVTRQDASVGSVTVMGAGRSNATPNLNEGRLFVGNSSNQAVADGTIHVDIDNSRVGIGTNNPGAQLDVRGASGYLKFDTSASDGTIKSDYNLKLYADDTGDNSSGYQNIQFYTAGANERMRIDSAGNVGIGVTEPITKLNIKGDQSANGQLYIEPTNDSEYAGLVIKTTRGADRAYAIFAGGTGTDDLNFRFRDASAGVDRMVIDSSGNVGIGIPIPLQKLHINGNVLLENNTEIRQKDSGGTQRTIIELDNSDDLNIGGSYSGALKFIGGGSYTEVMRIHDDGNVGIGTTLPETKVEIVNTPTTDTSISISNAKLLGLNIHVNGTGNNVTDTIYSGISLADGWAGIYGYDDGGSEATGLGLFTGNVSSVTERIRIKSNGNVGIGTTSPSEKLHVRGEQVYLYNDINANNTFFYARNSSSGNAGIKMKNSQGEWTIIANDRLRFYDDDNSVERFSILSSGNVGVGTTAPDDKLDVVGNLRISDSKTATTNKTNRIRGEHYDITEEPVTFMFMNSFSTANILYIGGGSAIENAATQLNFYTAANNTTTTGTVRMYIDASGNVNIGNNGNGGGAVIRPGGQTSVYALEVDRSGTGGSVDIWDNNDDSVIIGATSSEQTLTVKAGGNVGIGTTNPSQKLHVDGSALITNDITISGNLIVHGDCTTLNTTVTATSAFRVDNDGTGPALVANQTGAQPIVDFQDDDTSVFYIEDGGNVGVGTTDPGQKLHVAGSTLITNNNYHYGFNADGAQTALVGIKSNNYVTLGQQNVNHAGTDIYSGTGSIYFYHQATNRLIISSDVNVQGATDLNINGSNRRLRFTSGTGTIRTTSANKLYLQTDSTDALTIDASQNVGIGTTNPTQKLYVSGNAVVDGSIHLETAGDCITFYGNCDGHHGITSRDCNGAVSDDLRINSYASVYVNLDSNNNNSSAADFVVASHGGSASAMSVPFFCVNGENGNATASGDLISQDGRVITLPVTETTSLSAVRDGTYKWGSTAPNDAPDDYGWAISLTDGGQPNQLVQTYGGATNKMRLFGRRRTNGNWDTSWTEYWSNANDGAGSGLDADLLDGANSSMSGSAGCIARYCTANGYLYANSWIYTGDDRGLFAGCNNAHFFPNTGSDYGTWCINGNKGGWSGIHTCGGTFMVSSAGSVMGLYNDTDNEWILKGTFNGATELFYNGVSKLSTLNTGVKVSSSGEAVSLLGSTDGNRAVFVLDGASNGDGVGGDYAYLAHNADGSLDIKNLQDNSIKFGTGASGTTRMTITSGGSVGIGTDDPQRPFTLYKATNPVLQLVNSTTGTGDGRGFLLIQGALNTTIENSEAGYMAFRTSANEKMRIDSSGNVGIGTTSPSTLLTLHQASDTNIGGLRIENSDNSSAFRVWKQPSGGASVLVDNGVDTMFIKNGDVGIGTDDPNQKLEVFGNQRISNNGVLEFFGGTIYPQISRNSTSGGLIIDTAGGGVSNSVPLLSVRENGGTDFVTVLGSGNVGIGTTNPTEKLQIAGNVRVMPSSGDAFIRLTDDGTRNWDLRVSDGSDYFEIDGTTSTSLVITGAGNVGIGTVSPSAKLQVAGNTYLNSGSNVWNLIGNNGINFARETYFGYSSSYRILQLGTVEASRAISIGVDVSSNASGAFGGDEIIFPNQREIITPNAADNGYLGLIATDNQNKVRIGNYRWNILNDTPGITIDTSTSANNVGIGTDDPNQKLEVFGNQRISNNGVLEFFGGTVYPQISRNGTSGGLIIDTAGGGVSNSVPLLSVRENGGTDFVTVLGSGNVGIGTTSPSQALNIARSDASGSAIFDLYATNSLKQPMLTFRKSASNTIGTKSVTPDGGELGEIEFIGVNTGSNFAVKSASIISLQDGAAGATYIPGALTFGTGTNAAAVSERMRIDSSGNVGIGTTSPESKLHIYSGVDGVPQLRLYGANEDGIRISGFVNDAGNYAAVYAWDENDGGTASYADLYLGSTTTQGLFIKGSNGNVGIGTTNPSTDFSVKGHLLFNDTTRRLTISNNTNTGGINLDGGNSRLYFSGYRALEGNNSGSSLYVGEGYTTTTISSVFNVVDHETILSPDQGGSGGVASRALTIENINDANWTADALTAYNATTSYDIRDRASYSFFARPTQGNILTFASETNNNGTTHRFVNLNSSAVAPLYRWDFYQYDGSGTGTGDFKVPDKLFQIRVREGVSEVEKFTIKGNGNVGIGTDNPSQKLHVNVGRIAVTDGYNIGDTDADTGMFPSSNALFFQTAGTTRAAITSAGLFGIGTLSPTSGFKLDVVGADFRVSDVQGDDGVELGWSAGAGAGFVQAYDRGAGAFRNLTLNNSVTIEAAGDVGIGTTSPDAKVHIRTQTGTDTAGGSDSHIRFDVADDGGPAWAMRLGDTVTDGDFHIDRRIGGTWCNTMTLDRNTGNVGIGTTVPDACLHVHGNTHLQVGSTTGGRTAVMGSTSTTDAGALNYRAYWSYDSYWDNDTCLWNAKRTNLGRKWKAEMSYHDDHFQISRQGNACTTWANSDWSNFFTIDSAGKVGIGTASPDYNLHVKGSTSATLGLEGTGGSKDTWEITSSDLGGKAVLNFRNDDVSSTILTLHQDGCVIPGADNTIDLGSSSARWANVYANCTTTGAVIESNLCTNGLDSCPEGSVVIWRDGELQGTTDAYSHRVMGVTAPGSESPIVMGAENILVTGDIEEGDPIVTSDKYNHGMKGDRSSDLHGKVIAEALESGSGESYIIKGMIRKF